MLELHNVRMESSNVRKIKESPNVTKVQSHMMLILHNVKMVPSNVRKKSLNVTKVLTNVMLILPNVTMKPSNVRKKKKKTTKCDKRTFTCDVGTAQCENETVKCEKNVTWYIRLFTSGYRTPFFWEGTVELPCVERIEVIVFIIIMSKCTITFTLTHFLGSKES